jgi:hypothetical protein
MPIAPALNDEQRGRQALGRQCVTVVPYALAIHRQAGNFPWSGAGSEDDVVGLNALDVAMDRDFNLASTGQLAASFDYLDLVFLQQMAHATIHLRGDGARASNYLGEVKA